MEQQYIIENITSFNLKDIFECGQCFRWNKEEDNSYTGVIGNNVLNVNQIGNKVIFSGVCNKDIKEICIKYFDLENDYEAIKLKLSKIDENLENSIKYGEGIRILKQDLWETIISFIISANNNIPRIKKTIERIAKEYGKKLEFRGKIYYTFPTPEELREVKVEDFRRLGLGFRDIRLYETVQRTLRKEIDLENLQKEINVEGLKEKLLEIPGVGPKVADCIMLFALEKYQAFPIDVWVRRVMSELYFNNKEQKPKVIEQFAKNKYGELAGVAQQYLFYWRKNLA